MFFYAVLRYVLFYLLHVRSNYAVFHSKHYAFRSVNCCFRSNGIAFHSNQPPFRSQAPLNPDIKQKNNRNSSIPVASSSLYTRM